MKVCPGCNKLQCSCQFTRVSRHSGLVETGFVYCNKCVGVEPRWREEKDVSK
jgi:hypothetical protein